MHFQRLRLSGFKSFVEPTEFRIEAGLTGIVGPNGCGKSNLLEALRWVMGANSAKAMRAGGMEDVIFAGSGARPSRNHAEVALTIDNADRTAPAQFNDHPVLEVTRRIDRGDGSTYRINGREVRARDVQLLFADASTGANSPALVRQGQISELIAARPQNRRLILEEAAGVSGLHGRRHEAELRLRGAEANLLRLQDVAGELETTLARLRREARAAEKYRRVAAQARRLQGALLLARWSEAERAKGKAQDEAEAASGEVEAAARAAGLAAQASLAAAEAIRPLREEEAIAATVLQRLMIEKDRLELQAQQARAEVDRLKAEIARIAADQGREAALIADSQGALDRLGGEIVALEAEIAAAPERLPQLEAASRAAEVERAAAEAEVERLAALAAAREAERRAAAARLEEGRLRCGRAAGALRAAEAERASLGPAEDPRTGPAKARLEAALQALNAARAALETAESARAGAARDEAAARDAARKAEDQLARLKAEARGLAQLAAAPAKGGFVRAAEAVTPLRGLEAAIAAALGDDLDAALDARAAAFWGGAAAEAPVWPEGATPIAPQVAAPPALAARLAFVALVARADGARLQAQLPPGARLVSREGDLWRWDGFVSRAEAPRPAAVRMAQRTRLAELEAQIASLAPAAETAAQAQKAAADALRAADQTVAAARRAPPDAERVLGAAREAVDALAREAARREARAQSLDEALARLKAEQAEAAARLADVEAEAQAQATQEILASPTAQARQAAAAARERASAARAAWDIEQREREGRQRRLAGLNRDRDDWTRRSAGSAKRLQTLAEEADKAQLALVLALEAPEAITARKTRLLDDFALAEGRRRRAADALALGDRVLAEADRAHRQADQQAGQARERKAALDARLDAARERLAQAADEIRDQAQMEPLDLAARLRDGADDLPDDPAEVDRRLRAVERERDALGAVNLRAEEEAADYDARLATLRREQADLSGAIARLRQGVEALNAEGRERLLAAFAVINGHFKSLFQALFDGGEAELRLIESEDPLEAGLEIFACPPGKRLAAMSLMSGGEQALTAAALIFGVFLANPAPICVLDEVDAPLDDANVDRFCNLLHEMRRRTATRFIAITHNPVTMSRMDRLFGVTMHERGVSQLVSVDLRQAEALAAQ